MDQNQWLKIIKNDTMKLPNKFLFSALLSIFFFLNSSCKDDFNYSYYDPSNSYSNASQYSLGITRISADSLAFKLFAPGKTEVYLIGDFNDWQKNEKYKMNKDAASNTFFLKIGNLKEGQEYVCQYFIDNSIRTGDPYATKTSDPLDKYISSATYPNMLAYPTGASDKVAMVVSTSVNKYNWSVNNFTVKDPSNLVIYELLIRDFTGADNEIGNIKDAKTKIPYLKDLGVTAVELMPFNEFEGNESWGYNPSYYFATDKAYGTPQDYKDFIDECHKNGIAVIMDMVLNHAYGQCPLVQMYLTSDDKVTSGNPYFNVESPNADYSWGYDFNHESKYTQQFTDSVCSYWMSEFKVDGFRFDFTKGFTQTSGDGWAYDQSRISILKRMTSEVKKRKPEAIVIMEHLTDNKEETELADFGIYLWGNMNHNFNESTMGWGEENGDYGKKGDLSWASYQKRGWKNPNLVAYMESHDEERLMFKNKQYGKTDDTYDVKSLSTGLSRTAAATVIYMSIPGPKMIWQFGELGYDISIDENGRTGMKPSGWSLLDNPERVKLKEVYKKMIGLRNNNSTFSTVNYKIDLENNFKQVLLNSDNESICAIANLDVRPISATVNFGKAGTWKDQFSNSTLNITSSEMSLTLQPGEFRLYISN